MHNQRERERDRFVAVGGRSMDHPGGEVALRDGHRGGGRVRPPPATAVRRCRLHTGTQPAHLPYEARRGHLAVAASQGTGSLHGERIGRVPPPTRSKARSRCVYPAPRIGPRRRSVALCKAGRRHGVVEDRRGRAPRRRSGDSVCARLVGAERRRSAPRHWLVMDDPVVMSRAR